MISRLLACFALITGLAAVAGPVSASEVEALSCQIDAGAQDMAAGSDVHQACAILPQDGLAQSLQKAVMPAALRPSPIYPTVLIRIDRAYE